ncbi:hypothetical protein HOE22_10175 [Candidatus Woesearchaeota archaeon]|jgi:hypothetical protein|nr:hypothetical protein [Candidatus Woesearchaeota archaeon]MBT5758965.1 hypothetical protein [Candidatus Neomarinimicrobiota bacterium]
MALNAKGGVKIIEGKAYIHPLSIQEIEFLLNLLANAEHKGSELQKVMQVTYKLREEYKLIVEHNT